MYRHHPWFTLKALACACSVLASSCAWAQTPSPAPEASQPSAEPAPPDTSALPAVRVTAKREQESARGPVNGYRARRSATATRTDTPLEEIPQSISVITADQMRDQNAQSMQEVLRYSAGVHADVYGLDNRGDWFSLRGGSEGSTLLDGLRLPLTGWYGVVRNEPFAFERVEVLRGPSSVMAGQNGPGGVVNLVSKRPQAQAHREVGVQLGTDNHRQITADLTGPVNEDGTLLYRLVALARDADTQVEHAGAERQYIAPSITWQALPGTRITAYAEYQRDRSGSTEGFFPLEGTLYPGPQGYIPLERFVSEPGWDRYGGRRVRLGYEVEHQIDDRWSLTHRFRHDDVEGGMRSMYANYWEPYVDGRKLNRTFFATDDRSRITNADLILQGRLETGSVRHTVLVGLDALRSDQSKIAWSGAATPLDVYTPTYGTFVPVLSDENQQDSSGKTQTRQLGVLLQDQIKFGDRWVVVAGLRHDRVKSELANRTTADAHEDSAWSKSLGVVHLADGGWSPYASYAESFQSVSGGSLAEAYQPRRGRQVELGVKWMPPDTRWTVTAAAYRLKESSRLESSDDNTEQVQSGPLTVRGFELEARADLRQWDVVAAYSRTHATDDETGHKLPNVPEHTAALWAVHKLGAYGLPGAKVGLGVRHVGKTWDGTDTLSTDAVTLFDAMASWDSGDRWLYALNVTNLADKTYFAACLDRGDCWYGNKRKVTVSATYRW